MFGPETRVGAKCSQRQSALTKTDCNLLSYWISVKNGQPINPSTGGTGTRGETHIPLPVDTMPPKR